jgi:UDP-N-acetyl-3-dehydro-alpha-D-glucosamine 3-aminotranferase
LKLTPQAKRTSTASATRKEIPMVDLRAQFAAIEKEVRHAIDEVLATQVFILGPQLEALEREMAQYCGSGRAVGVASGTDALLLALRASRVGSGDEVIVPAFTFLATAGAVVAAGARPVFADSDPKTLNIAPESVRSLLTPRTKAIIAVHLYGGPAEMDPLLEIASHNNLLLIEDNAQSLGASLAGKKLGSFSACATTSFYPSKNLGAYGDAGMVFTDSEEMAGRVARLRNHGQTGPYLSAEPGWNSRLDEIQAAVLRVKIRYLDRWIAARRAHAERYGERFANVEGITTPVSLPNSFHSYYLYTVQIPSERRNPAARRDHVAQHLASRGIATSVFYPLPLHLQPAYASLGGKPGQLPVAERAAHEVLSLPLYPEMTNEQIDRVADSVTEALKPAAD